MKKFLVLMALVAAPAAHAQQNNKAWEIGAGVSALQFNRVKLSNVSVGGAGTVFDMQLRHGVWGGNVYLARQFSNAFAVDLQGVLGRAEGRWLGQIGAGLQWRLGHYFRSCYIDPYLRVGANYMYKGFDIYYADAQDGLAWQMENNLNKEGRDGRHLLTIALGGGVNMWLNDRFGVGLQADYLLVPKTGIANSLMGTARVMWRFGGERCATNTGGGGGWGSSASGLRPMEMPPVRVDSIIVKDTVYVERRVVERVVERESVYEVLQAVFFDFNSAELREEFVPVLSKVAEILKEDTSRRYLLTGYTDSRGSSEYDDRLSYERARTVRQALIDQGVPTQMLKIVGGGKRVSRAASEASDHAREGDRKVTIELITNADYWEVL